MPENIDKTKITQIAVLRLNDKVEAVAVNGIEVPSDSILKTEVIESLFYEVMNATIQSRIQIFNSKDSYTRSFSDDVKVKKRCEEKIEELQQSIKNYKDDIKKLEEDKAYYEWRVCHNELDMLPEQGKIIEIVSENKNNEGNTEFWSFRRIVYLTEEVKNGTNNFFWEHEINWRYIKPYPYEMTNF